VFKSKSIKTRYMWAGMIICLVSLSLVSGVSYFASSRITTELLDTHVSELAASKAREFDTWLEFKEIIIASMAQDIEASENFSNENLSKLIESKMRLHAKELIDIYVGFENRSPSLISGVGWTAPPDYDPRTRDWYMEAAKTDQVIFTNPYVDAMTGGLVITVARALRHNGQLVGVLATDIYITELIRLVNSLHVSDNSYSLLLDESGQIIAHLPHHCPDGFHGQSWIVRCVGEKQRIFIETVFEIRQVNIHHTVEHPNHIGIFVAAAIVDKRYSKPLHARHAQSLHDQWRLRCRCYRFDIVTAAFLQIEHDFGQL